MNWGDGGVWLAVEPVDMRRGIDGLSLLLQDSLGRAPADGSAYAFRNRRGTRLKLLFWDGTGVWLAQRDACTADVSSGPVPIKCSVCSAANSGPGSRKGWIGGA